MMRENLSGDGFSVLCALPAVLPRIYDGPASLPRSLTEEEVKIHRDVMCKKYNQCLKRAARWQGFSCLGCPSFGRGAESYKERLEELAASRE
ncbi:MAG: hypothetical protein Kow0090_06050 [Myxococcota bacterium]